ncbi:NAD(P)-binding protein [Periconia macrospinosa]|uniref:NAD(P)-binding protein n=1 Tax=Periconia macrospinosa TaxID=97972 RepID=A0A2V1DFR9_9PLEO|nr:NAD(P)-binding protein [Periconia macrospinosa]
MATHSEWNQETGGLEVAKAFAGQLKGKTVLITGVSPESIGSSTALAIASQDPALLILASRTASKLDAVKKSIKEGYPSVHVENVILDFASQDAIKKAASEIAKLTNRIDIIINNAAVMSEKLIHTAEGIEMQFGAGHVGHFLLTNLLLPQLLEAAKSSTPGATRVVNVSSVGHRLSGIRFHDYNFEGKDIPADEQPPPIPPMFAKSTDGNYNGWIAYGQAKTANILFSLQLNKLLKAKGIVSYAAHPGSIATGLSRDLSEDSEAALAKVVTFWKNHDQGSATTLVAAFDPALNDPKGIMLSDCQLCDAAPHATNPEAAEKLWALSEKLVKTNFKL